MTENIDYDDLDPGIRGLVRRLRAAGFETVDSGDGSSKASDGWIEGDYLPYPHVAMLSTPATMIADADRLMACLIEWGVVMSADDPETDPHIEASYSPTDGHAVLMVVNVNDLKLGEPG